MENNRFAIPMSKRTDKDLIKIVSIERNVYESLAVEAAEVEITKRGLEVSMIENTISHLTYEFEKQQKLDNTQVGLGVRFLHFFIDTIAYYIIFAFLIVFAYQLMPLYFNQQLLTLGFITLFLVAFFGYYMFMECTFQKTIGKYITKTKVVTKEGEKPDFSTILKRTILRLLPFDHITFITGNGGFHDIFSKTMVVKDNPIHKHEK